MKPLFILCLTLLLAACKEPETPEVSIRPAQVWTVKANQQATTTTYSGEVQAHHTADLAFRVNGKILQRHVEMGDQVQAGQVLASLDTADLQLNLASTRANLNAAKADLGKATTELARIRKLHQKDFIGQSALDAAQAAHDAAAARVKAAQAQLQLSSNQTHYTELSSDRAGLVVRTYAEAGQVVAAGTPVVRVAYEGELEVHTRIGETQAQTLATGTLVDIKLWAQPNNTLQGKITDISPITDATRSYLVKIKLLNPPDNIRLGMTADIQIANQDKGNSVLLPSSALFQQEQQSAVWLVGDANQVTLHPVQIISYQQNSVSVTGLKTDTKIIAAGVHKLHAGQTINPVPYDGKVGL